MRVVAWVLITACLLTGAGCALFNKRGGSGGGERTAAADKSKPAPRPENSDPLMTGKAGAPERGGMLAGQVLDNENGHPAETFIRVVCLDDGKQEEPYEVAVTAQGYFAIPNLKQGKQYKLVARAKQGDRLLAGTTYATAPNPRLVIKLSENFGGGDVPPVPRPSELGKPQETPKSHEKAASSGGAPYEPGVGSVTIPQPGSQPPPWGQAPQQPGSGWKQGIVREQPPGLPDSPLLDTTGPRPPPPPPMQDPSNPPMSLGPTQVPSCVLVGKHLVNFALPDLSGGTWEWRVNRRGKVVLLDFWKTACPPCVEAIPNLTVLQWQYGRSGLEVVSVACEADGSPQEQAYRVASMAQRKRTNYRLLLGGGRDNPVVSQFAVHSLPTLVLLDENGDIVWRHEGGLSGSDLEVLRRQIQTRLGAR